MLPPEPDVIAYDENMGVLYQWSACPGVTAISELPSNGLARMAIQQAHLIRRRDGLVLKGRVNEETYEAPEELNEDEPVPYEHTIREPHELKRVELIPPPEELEEHSPLSNEQLAQVALWVTLQEVEPNEVLIDDKDIVNAMTRGSISVEKLQNGAIIFRAHSGALEVIRVGGSEGETDGAGDYIAAMHDAIDVINHVFAGETRPKSMADGSKKAISMLVKLIKDSREPDDGS